MEVPADCRDALKFENEIFDELYRECKRLVAGSCVVSNSLRKRLEEFDIEKRKEIVSRKRDDCAPLFIACQRGHVQTVEYLIRECHADIEQRGKYKVAYDPSVHCVTPLWCAAACGHLPVVKCLKEHGADINAVSESGSTPVRAACFRTHIDIVSYLVENGADILKPNYTGGTCLINSVQSVELCTLLLHHGADINATDIQNKTALHYAIQEYSPETTKLLIENNADPYIKSRYNDDALQTACIKGAVQIFDYLVENVRYSSERLADAYELIGSTFLDEHNDMEKAVDYWGTALAIRTANAVDGVPIPKRPELVKRECYQNATEFTTHEELNAIAGSINDLRVQSLLICERVLGAYHKVSLTRLTLRGAFYVDVFRYQDCIDLWIRALEIRVEKNSILHTDTFFHALSLLTLMVDLTQKSLEVAENQNRDKEEPRFCDIVKIFTLLSSQFAETRELLEIQPIYTAQRGNYGRIVKLVTHLIYLLIKRATTDEEKMETKELVTNLIRQNPRPFSSGDTLLHFCVSKTNTISCCYSITDDSFYSVLPTLDVVKLLLECGAPVNARNELRSTPLHIACEPYNFDNLLVKLLLDYGAHLDLANQAGETPLRLISLNPANTINLLNYMSLRCYAIQVIRKYDIHCANLPVTLYHFLKCHSE